MIKLEIVKKVLINEIVQKFKEYETIDLSKPYSLLSSSIHLGHSQQTAKATFRHSR